MNLDTGIFDRDAHEKIIHRRDFENGPQFQTSPVTILNQEFRERSGEITSTQMYLVTGFLRQKRSCASQHLRQRNTSEQID